MKRDPHNFLILLQKILRKTKEVKKCKTNTDVRTVWCDGVFHFRVFLSFTGAGTVSV